MKNGHHLESPQTWDDAPPASPILSGAKTVTIAWDYYEAPNQLTKQLQRIAGYPVGIRSNLRVLLSDCGSPINEAETVARRIGSVGVDVRILRFDFDLGGDWHAARNVAMREANGWCVVTGIDHFVPPATLWDLQNRAHDPGTIYRLKRTDQRTSWIVPDRHSFFCRASGFWQVGPYNAALDVAEASARWREKAADCMTVKTLGCFIVRAVPAGDPAPVSTNARPKTLPYREVQLATR